jgi:GGDEF domain-containing protein
VREQPDRSVPPSGVAAERLRRAAHAAQQLCDVLWETLREELQDPQAERVKELSGRLVEVSATVASLVGERASLSVGEAKLDSPGPALANGEPGTPQHGATASASTAADGSSSLGRSPVSAASPGAAPVGTGSSEPPVERRKPPAPSRPQAPPPAAPRSIPASGGEYTFTRLVDEQEQGASQQPLASVEPIQPEIEIRDVRREEGPSAWVSSVGRLLARHAEDGLPFAVLLVEIVDVARLERSETPHDLHGLVAQVERALGRGMRATDRLSRETLGRYWLVAPETNGTGAHMLAERLARLVRTSATHRNVPMEVAIGIAVCPDDGTEAPALAARADLGVYSARATGRSIAHTDPPPAS